MSDSLWDENRAKRYLDLYNDPRKQTGSQSILCRDLSNFIPKESKDVLDFGCGMGHLLPYIVPEGGFVETEYYGLDYSPTMLKYFKKFFPGFTAAQMDAALPYDKFREELLYNLGKDHFEITASVSLFIHLPTIEQVKNLLENMYHTCTKATVFCVETAGDKKMTRKDGLTLRNIPIQWIYEQLKNLGVKPGEVTHAHQKISYQGYYAIFPLQAQPFYAEPPQMYTRTTIFKIRKG